jgi:hypothetical protein
MGLWREGEKEEKEIGKTKKENRVKAGLENFYPVSFGQSEREAIKDPRVTQPCTLMSWDRGFPTALLHPKRVGNMYIVA